ncbi:MAG TPA: hypothetical protein PK231_00450 [Acidocella sp.]|uniref:hypothetical protein n=1 Tax=Acidiphilium sp. 20-67-58 TaxID=1970291 RepID=UPI000BD3653B|nr:hypothetical protein [Acidiphilium sp. 20-67-58]OYV54803.1 MAG: hypothetical protein B7Z76_13020 [Acidiphilium sp. 20-67-58]HQT37861.1 hypothetical protein [Acidocella sp.]
MAMNLHTCFNKVFSATTVAQISHEVQRPLDGGRGHRPVVVMHWVEQPGGRVTYHWDTEVPQADFTAH